MKSIILTFLIFLAFQLNAQFGTMNMTTNPISFEPQSSHYLFQNGTNYIWVSNNLVGRWYEFEVSQTDGDLNIQEGIDLNPTTNWQADPYSDYYKALSPACYFSLTFTVNNVDQHPVDNGVITIRWRSAPQKDAIPDQPWLDFDITVNVDDPTFVGPRNHVCYSPSSVFIISNYPAAVSSFSHDVSSNLQVLGYYIPTMVIVGATSSSSREEGWIQPKYNMTGGYSLYCNKKEVWVGKPGQPTMDPTGNPTYQMDLNRYKLITVPDKLGATTFSWTATGSIDRRTDQIYHHMLVKAISTGSGTFYCHGINTCGTGYTTPYGYVWVSSDRSSNPLMISPNPADSYIDITFDEEVLEVNGLLKTDNSYDFGENAIFRIIDQFGSVILIQKYSGEKVTRINTSKLLVGFYTVQLVLKDMVYSANLVISR